MIVLFVLIFVIIYYKKLTESIINSSILWFYKVMPGLFIINVFADLLIYGNNLSINPLLKLIKKVFRLDSLYSSLIILISPLIGNPGSLRLIYNFYIENKISHIEAIHLLKFNNYINPIYLVAIISSILNLKIALIILISNILSNFLFGIFYFKKDNVKTNTFNSNYKPLMNRINSSLENVTKMLIIIWSSITFFGVIIEIIKSLPFFNYIPTYLSSLILGIIEITNGLNTININNLYLNVLYISIIIGFNGLSIVMQEYLISNTVFKLKDIIYPKIPVCLLTGIISLGGLYVL